MQCSNCMTSVPISILWILFDFRFYIASPDLRGIVHKDGDNEDMYISTISRVEDTTSSAESGYVNIFMVLYKVSEDDEIVIIEVDKQIVI